MELMPRGSLSSFIKKNKKTLRWSERYKMMLDVCEGMAFLHFNVYAAKKAKHFLFHQDLKIANVLLTAEGWIIRG
jgi:serine/threonine protein kinase